jgi:hypothetical protein
LSRVPAGPWPFPTLSLPSVCGCSDPYPAVFVRCACPCLLRRQRPHVTGNTFGTRENPCEATSTGSGISGLQSFADLRAPTLARPPGRSHRSPVTGRPGRVHHAWPEGLPTSGCGIATCLHGHLTRLDFHQLDGSLVGCSSLHAAQALPTPLAERGDATSYSGTTFTIGAWSPRTVVRWESAPVSVATAVICLLSSGGWPNSLVRQDQMDVGPLSRGVMLPVGVTHIHSITEWPLLLPSSPSRTSIGLPCGSLSLTGDVRGYHVPSQSQRMG